MSKLITTLRRAILASLIAGSLIPSTFAGGRFDSVRQSASQAKSSFSNRAQSTRQSAGNAAQQFKSQAKSQFKQHAPGAVNTAFNKFQDAKSKVQQVAPRGVQNKFQGLKDKIQTSGIVQGGMNRATGLKDQIANKFNQKPGGTAGGVFNRDLSSQINKSGIAGGAGYDRLKAEKEMFKNRGNTGITGRGIPTMNNSTAMNGSRPVDTSKMQTISLGGILSAPLDAAGSVANGAGKHLPGPAGDAAKAAGKGFDTAADIHKGAIDAGVKVIIPEQKKIEKKGSTTHILTNGQAKTVPPPKPIKSSGKAKNKADFFHNADGSKKASLPVISGSSNGTGGGFIQMFPMQADGTFKTPASNTPVTQAPPAGNQGNGNGNGGNRPNRGNFGNVVGQVMSNLPQRGSFGGGFQGGGNFAPAQDFAPAQYAEPAPQAYEAAPVQVAAPQVLDTETSTADLVLIDVKLVEPATQLAGPAYSLKFANQGLAATGKFITAAITSNDGKADRTAPKAMVEVPGMAGGATKEIMLRLPRGQSKYLVLALDMNGTVSETDKDNNVSIIERAE